MTEYALKRDDSHVQEALALLTGQFSHDTQTPNIRNLVRILAARVQDVENTLWDVIESQLLVKGPTGQALNQLGDLVGEPRNGLGDSAYLLWILVAIRARRSGGRTEDLLAIGALALGLGQVSYTDYYPVRFEIYAPALPDMAWAIPLGQAMSIARPPGVYGVLDWYDQPTITRIGLPVLTLSDSVSGLGGTGFGDSVSGVDECVCVSSIAL
jgi:hypothetical protein